MWYHAGKEKFTSFSKNTASFANNAYKSFLDLFQISHSKHFIPAIHRYTEAKGTYTVAEINGT